MSEKVKKVTVTYSIPVEVVVNLETGEIERVDEWRSEVGGYSFGTHRTEDGDQPSQEVQWKADEIIESAEWPTWNAM
jgi:hypothetical protein